MNLIVKQWLEYCLPKDVAKIDDRWHGNLQFWVVGVKRNPSWKMFQIEQTDVCSTWCRFYEHEVWSNCLPLCLVLFHIYVQPNVLMRYVIMNHGLFMPSSCHRPGFWHQCYTALLVTINVIKTVMLSDRNSSLDVCRFNVEIEYSYAFWTWSWILNLTIVCMLSAMVGSRQATRWRMLMSDTLKIDVK